jgi:tRNA-specific 2-thiouridylase
MRAMSASSSTRIVVGLSGGVDSAVAALLLKERGFEVHGLFMSNWEDDDSYCTEAQDYQDARAVARELGVPLHRVSFAAEYRDRVFAYFLREHEAGRTPNPDVLCNREIKFGVALKHAERLGAAKFATGHYARLVGDGPTVELQKAIDGGKDQTYFLHAVAREDLGRSLMPIGDLHKADVRERARKAGLPVFDKPDSTGICFIGERPFRDFLSRFVKDEPGPIEAPDGERLGTHRGLAFYTLGQRGGLMIGGRRGHSEEPWYVAAKDAARNTLVIVQGHNHPLLSSSALTTGPMHWLLEAPSAPLRCTVKVRYRQADQRATLTQNDDGSARIDFDEPQRAVTPGQYAVIYDGDRCLGGGVINVTIPATSKSPEFLYHQCSGFSG